MARERARARWRPAPGLLCIQGSHGRCGFEGFRSLTGTREGLGWDGVVVGDQGRGGARPPTAIRVRVSDGRRVLRTTAVREGVPACVEGRAGHAEDGLSSDAACRPRGGFDVVGANEMPSGRWGVAFLAASRRRGSQTARSHSQAHLDQLWIWWPPRHSLQTEPLPSKPWRAGCDPL